MKRTKTFLLRFSQIVRMKLLYKGGEPVIYIIQYASSLSCLNLLFRHNVSIQIYEQRYETYNNNKTTIIGTKVVEIRLGLRIEQLQLSVLAIIQKGSYITAIF